MTGTSPFPTHQSPSFHSTSYVPKFEANFMRDFCCCETIFPTMHELLQHYEQQHPDGMSDRIPAMGNLPGTGRTSFSKPSTTTTGSTMGRTGMGFQNSSNQSRQGSGTGASGMGNGFHTPRQQSQSAMPQRQTTYASMNDDETVGDMELDDPVGPMDMDEPPQRTMQQTRQVFGQQRPPLPINTSGLTQGLRTSTPTTPSAANFGFTNNPTVSSVNTPTLTTQQGFPQRAQPTYQAMSGMGNMGAGNLNLNDNNFGMGFANNLAGLDLNSTIDNPEKRLFSPSGSQNQVNQQRALNQQISQFGVEQLVSQVAAGAAGPETQALLHQLSQNLVAPPEEHKPYKCPVVGCEKAYKNQNGLK